MRTNYAEATGLRWLEIDDSLGNDDILSTGIRIGLLARHRERLLARALVAFGARGVRSMEDYRLLALVTRIDPQPTSASDASSIVGLSKAATAVRFDRFEAAGLVQRAVRDFDRRTIEVRVTETGRDLAIECTHTVKAVYSKLLGDFDDTEHQQLRTLLRKIDTSR